MKKTLLAAALAVGFAGVAQAETSVTLYGLIDTGIGYERSESRFGGEKVKHSRTGIRNGVQAGNRWGLRGSEDLGNGLRAVFQLESGFDSATGHQQQGGRLFGRHATLGLASDSWGQLDFGRQTNIASKYLPGIVDPFGGGFGQANMGSSFSPANTLRLDNMVMYQTPNFSGFQFGVGYSFNAAGGQQFKRSGGDDPNTRAITTGLRYANGPIGVALTYDQFKTPRTAGGVNWDSITVEDIIGAALGGTTWADLVADATTGGGDRITVHSWNLGAAYDFEVVKVSLAVGQTRNGWFQGHGYGNLGGTPTFAADKDIRVTSYLVGLSAPVGAGRVLASWQMADPKDRGIMEDADKQQVYSLGYTYPLSKRTNVYAYGSYAKNVGFNVFNGDKAKSTAIGVGLRHQF